MRRMDDGYSRVGVHGETELDDGWAGFYRYERRVSANDGEDDGAVRGDHNELRFLADLGDAAEGKQSDAVDGHAESERNKRVSEFVQKHRHEKQDCREGLPGVKCRRTPRYFSLERIAVRVNAWRNSKRSPSRVLSGFLGSTLW